MRLSYLSIGSKISKPVLGHLIKSFHLFSFQKNIFVILANQDTFWFSDQNQYFRLCKVLPNHLMDIIVKFIVNMSNGFVRKSEMWKDYRRRRVQRHDNSSHESFFSFSIGVGTNTFFYYFPSVIPIICKWSVH